MASLPLLTLNSSGRAVRDLETRLTALGFDPGSIDGRFDSDTVAAVKAFQRKRRLDIDGEVGPLTWAQIISEELNDASGTGPDALAKELVKVAKAQYDTFDGDSRADTVLCTQIKTYYDDLNLGFVSCTDQPWSAAFVSWCVSQAGTTDNDFRFSAAHAAFVHAAIKSADTKTGHWRAVPFNAVRLRVGDIVQNNRDTPAKTFDFARNNAQYSSHSAIVVEVNQGFARTIGGNEGDAIERTKVNLTPAGRVKARDSYPYIALLRHV